MHEQAKPAAEMSLTGAQYRLIAENTVDWESWLGPTGKLLWVNAAVETMTGYSAAECLAMSDYPLPLIHPEDRDLARHALADRQTGISGKGQRVFRLLHKNGQIRWGDAVWQTMRAPTQELPGTRMSVRDITEMKEAQDRINLYNAQFMKLFETMEQGVVYQRADGIITAVNPAALRILGLSLDEIQGRTSMDPRWKTIREDGTDCPGSEHAAMVALRTGKPVTNFIMGVYHPKAQEHRWLLISATPEFRPGEPTPYQAFATFFDITEQKKAKENLQFQARILNQIRDFVTVTDTHGDLRYMNAAAEQALGLRAADVLGQPVSKIYSRTPEDEALQQRIVCETLRQGHWQGEVRNYHADGQEIVLDVRTQTACDAQGQPQFLIGISTDITERKRMELALRESETRLRLAVKATNDVIWDWDIVKNQQRWNEAGIPVFGWPDIVHAPQTAEWWTARVHPDDHQRVAEKFHQAVMNPQCLHWEDEYRFRKGDGHYADVYDRGYVVRDEQGQAIRMIGAMLNITERKQAETALRASQELLQQITAHVPGALYQYDDTTGAVLYVSEGAYAQFGLPRETQGAAIFEWMAAHVAPADQARFLESSRQASQTASPWHFEGQFILPSGKQIWIRGDAQPHRIGGRLLHHGIIQDVTSYKEADLARQQSEERFRSVFDNMLVGIAAAEIETGTIILANPHMAEMLGYPLEELTRVAISDLHAAADAARVADLFRQLAQGEKNTVDALPFKRKDGSLIYLSLSAQRLEIAGKACLAAVFLDVTEKLKAEQALQKHVAELAAKNIELTRFKRLTVGRELRMVELKNEINALGARLGEAPRYPNAPDLLPPTPA